jgi:hypothetical protein
MKLLALLILFICPLQALELQRVILATNNNPNYIQFWPIVAPLWKQMGLKPTLALIADKDCPIDTSLGDVIRFDPLPDVPESLQAQAIRLLLPVLFPNETCLISDIDMLPISKRYFEEGAKGCPDYAFLVYRNKAPGYAQGGKYPMCYLAAKGYVFSAIFGICTYEQIPGMLRNFAKAGLGWYTDEWMVYAYAKQWEKRGGRIFCLNHTVEARLDRIQWNVDFNNLEIGKYIDCHCPRPYSEHRSTIDRVVEAIKRNQ